MDGFNRMRLAGTLSRKQFVQPGFEHRNHDPDDCRDRGCEDQNHRSEFRAVAHQQYEQHRQRDRLQQGLEKAAR